MRALLREELPSHAVFGEEGGMTPGDGSDGCEYLWVLDPIDGTKSFITGAPARSFLAPELLGRIGRLCPEPSCSCVQSSAKRNGWSACPLFGTNSDLTHGGTADLLMSALQWRTCTLLEARL